MKTVINYPSRQEEMRQAIAAVHMEGEPFLIEAHANPDGRLRPVAAVVTMQDWELLNRLKNDKDLLEKLGTPQPDAPGRIRRERDISAPAP